MSILQPNDDPSGDIDAQEMNLEFEPPMNPNIVYGKTHHGLTYYVLPTPIPKGKIFLRLVVRVGSNDEGPDEWGIAHIVEHLAFRKHVSSDTKATNQKDAVPAFLKKIGALSGPDSNASTTFEYTGSLRVGPEFDFRWRH